MGSNFVNALVPFIGVREMTMEILLTFAGNRDPFNAEIVKVVQQPDFAERLAIDGAELQVTSPELFTRYVEAEIQKWGKVIRDSGTKGE